MDIKKFKATLIDIDGTLIKTDKSFIIEIVSNTLKDLNRECGEKDIFKFWYGYGSNTRDELVEKLFDVKKEDFWKIFHEYNTLEKTKKCISVYDDVKVIKELKRYMKIAIVTSTSPNTYEMKINFLKNSLNVNDNFFDLELHIHNPESMRKPNPGGLLRALYSLELRNFDVCHIGNADEDTLACKKSKIYDILVDRDECETSLMPTRRIKSLHELIS